MAWAESVGVHWEKIEAEYNAEWAKLAYLDGPGYTVWDRMEAKSDLQRRYFSRSSSHGVVNSPVETLTQSVESHFTSPRVESLRELDHGKAELNRQHNSRMAEYTREIRESCARILELLQEASPVHELNLTTSTKNSTTDFNGGMVVLPEETTQKLIDTPESYVGSKPDVKTALADSFLSEHLVVDSVVERDCYSTKVTLLDMDRKQNNSPVVINQGIFIPSVHLSDPPDLVLPPPPLAPPWIHDNEVLTGTSSQFSCPITQFASLGTKASDDHTPSTHTYHMFVEMPLRATLFCNIVLFQDMKTVVARLQNSSLHVINLPLGSVLFVCNTFESLVLGTKDIASLVQNRSAISELNLNRPPKKPPYHDYHTEDETRMTDSTHIFIPKIIPSQLNVTISFFSIKTVEFLRFMVFKNNIAVATHFLCRNLLPLKLEECILAFMCLQFKTESCHQNLLKVHVPIIKDLMVEDAEEGSHIAKIFFMELLSYAFISKCYVVRVMDFIYEVFDLMKWISGCGFVSGTLMFKQGGIKPLRFILTLSGVILKFPLKAHPSSWLSEFNIQGGHSDDHGLHDHDKLECENNGYTYPGGENDVVWTTKMARLVFLYCFVISRVAGFDTYKEFLVGNVVIFPWDLMEFHKHLAKAWAIPGHNGVFTLPINFEVLRNLSGVKTIQEFLVNDGHVSMFIRLMKPKEETSQVFSTKFFQNMDSTDELIRQILNLFFSSSGSREFFYHIENMSQSVCQYFSTSDSRLAGVKW